jgi:uncharacterized membrane protein
MLRSAVKKHFIGMNKEFRYRGEDSTRIEALSDSVFALAIGLLLISTSAPSTFTELMVFTHDLLPLALCITLITLVWFEHFKFFIRYGFRSGRIVLLNTILLFLLLFYVYPLKFLTKLLVKIYFGLIAPLFGINTNVGQEIQNMISADEMNQLMIIYGLGAASLFFVLMLMYRYALKQKVELELNEIEIFDTKASTTANFLMASIPLLSVFLVIVIPNPIVGSAISGFSYFLYWPVMTLFGKRSDKTRKALINQLVTSSEETTAR